MAIKVMNNQQQKYDLDTAVLKDRSETLEATNAELEIQITGHKAVSDSLVSTIRTQNIVLDRYKTKYAVIALKYETERNRVKEVTDDEAAGIFLDRADCSEVPVLKYDSNYLIPIEPIRFYNDVLIGFDEQVETNRTLRGEVYDKGVQIVNYERLTTEQKATILAQTELNRNTSQMLMNSDKQLANTEKKLKRERVKKYVVGVVGLVGMVVVGML
jgi:hypothetical protein